MSSQRKKTSIDNFNQEATVVKINSPRSVEAMRRQGVISQDIASVDYATVVEEVRLAIRKESLSSPVVAPKIPGYVNKKDNQTEEKLI